MPQRKESLVLSRLPRLDEITAVAGPRKRMMRHTAFARELGIHPRTERRAFNRGALPGAVEHGERILMVPAHLFRLACAYGLRGVERMAKAGLLTAEHAHSDVEIPRLM